MPLHAKACELPSEAKGRPLGEATELAQLATDIANRPDEEWLLALYFNRQRELLDDCYLKTFGHQCPPRRHQVDVGMMLMQALAKGAHCIVTVRHHPHTGDYPMRRNIENVHRLLEEARTIGVKLHDHIILSRGPLFSFRGGWPAADRQRRQQMLVFPYEDFGD